MRNALDLNDCYVKDEILIYKSTSNFFSKIFFFLKMKFLYINQHQIFF